MLVSCGWLAVRGSFAPCPAQKQLQLKKVKILGLLLHGVLLGLRVRGMTGKSGMKLCLRTGKVQKNVPKRRTKILQIKTAMFPVGRIGVESKVNGLIGLNSPGKTPDGKVPGKGCGRMGGSVIPGVREIQTGKGISDGRGQDQILRIPFALQMAV